ncbi:MULTISPECIES: hypothetical protein [unclassified Sinorhizobium]|uniref:hypothetical protein n=1 Tax=unclassified Sinorhizobium TaxID=2613772 RepID=UPI0035255F62
MSSELDLPCLCSADLNMLQDVLEKGGFDADTLLRDEQLFNAAAILMIKLFQEGTTSPEALSLALESHFGKLTPARKAVTALAERHAIQRLPSSDQVAT